MQAPNTPLWLSAQWATDIPVIAGVSLTSSPFAKEGFNLAHHVEDDIDHVIENRKKLSEATHLSGQWLWLNQIHSTTVIEDNQYNEHNNYGDAIISRNPKKIATVLTADCVPILISNQEGTEVAAIHAGWSGIYQDILTATLTKLHTPTTKLYAWIGPCASAQAYEVDENFYQRFIHQDKAYHSYFRSNRPNHYLADLVGMTKHLLIQNQISPSHITGGNFCSIKEARFFSYRRDGKLSGRMASFIAPKAA
ncbi:peptidoglycan editing factor PgeF [Suttonella ornithocola]|uniref:Purine nucleoside phosphorylase n=1 Tax=Suttonella ornithocola TaxID=279832 RepID=A0A380MYY6_9GAMM|nr:peptidoglycan editing factor PgeF [Suttonella ornithocola]SUO97522.1 Laccase domain protein yfiH [Suttonella ornithocola]